MTSPPRACMPEEPQCDYRDNNCNGIIDEFCADCGPEICNGEDSNCNGIIDDGCPDCVIRGAAFGSD